MKKNIQFFTTLFVLGTIITSINACSEVQENTKHLTEDNVKIVMSMYDSFEAGDIPAVLEKMDADIVWNEAENYPYADGNPYVGPDAILEGVFARMGEEWETFKITDQSIYPVGDNMVLATGRYKATYKETGETMDAQHAHIWWLEDEKVTRFQQYTDTKQAWETVYQ